MDPTESSPIKVDLRSPKGHHHHALHVEPVHHYSAVKATCGEVCLNTTNKTRKRLKALVCLGLVGMAILSGYVMRDYVQQILVFIESQDDIVIFLLLIVLYILVSMPFAWGYILVNVVTGYLYGIIKGILITFVTATIGVMVANALIKACLVGYNVRWLLDSNRFTESLDIVMSSEEQAFKLVILSRLTPIPFGVQNAFFAVKNSLSTSRYLQATCIGLLPCQVLNVYLGSTFRSMEQLLADSETAQIGAVVMAFQVAVAIAITVFVVRKSRQQLETSLRRRASASSNCFVAIDMRTASHATDDHDHDDVSQTKALLN